MRKLFLSMPLLLCCGCATLTQGTSQLLTFSIEPKEAVCDLTRVDEGKLGSISGKNNMINVTKDKDDIVIQCSAPGYKQSTTRLVSSASGAGVVGAVTLDLGLVDFTTGAMWKYPTENTITLEKEAG
ncbi:MAG: hypothetical protein HQL56_05710 [Magnetococcales bacterium]|nr:hypothetical protein [Magnetococcales bacterium]